MNVNLVHLQDQIERSRQLLEGALKGEDNDPKVVLHHEPVLVHQYPVELPGVYEVWFATSNGMFVHVTPEGQIVEQYSITPEIYFPEGE